MSSTPLNIFSYSSSSNVFSWKIPLDAWSGMAVDDCLNLSFKSFFPPDNNKVLVWHLDVYPKGINDDEKHIHLELKAIWTESVEMPGCQIETAYRIRKNTTNKPLDMYSSRSYGNIHSSELIYDFYSSSRYLELEKSYDVGTVEDRAENGFLTLELELKTYLTPEEKFQADGARQNQIFIDNFKAFYNDESGDVKIICDGKEFFCHKLLLTSQSPVFRAMFAHASKENEEGSIPIEDCTSEALQEFLFFLYHAKLRPAPFTSADLEVVFGLVHLASKYQIQVLVDVTKDLLMDIMNVDNVLKIMVMVDKYPELKMLALIIHKFMKENIEVVVTKEGWTEFVTTMPSLVTDFIVNNMND